LERSGEKVLIITINDTSNVLDWGPSLIITISDTCKNQIKRLHFDNTINLSSLIVNLEPEHEVVTETQLCSIRSDHDTRLFDFFRHNVNTSVSSTLEDNRSLTQSVDLSHTSGRSGDIVYHTSCGGRRDPIVNSSFSIEIKTKQTVSETPVICCSFFLWFIRNPWTRNFCSSQQLVWV
jgi:hypothetical protein